MSVTSKVLKQECSQQLSKNISSTELTTSCRGKNNEVVLPHKTCTQSILFRSNTLSIGESHKQQTCEIYTWIRKNAIHVRYRQQSSFMTVKYASTTTNNTNFDNRQVRILLTPIQEARALPARGRTATNINSQ